MEPIVTNQQLEEHEGVLIRIVPVDPFVKLDPNSATLGIRTGKNQIN